LCHEEAAMPQISNLLQILGEFLIFCILGLTTCVICVCSSLVLCSFFLSLSLSLSLTNSLKFLKICSPGEVMMLCHIFDFVCSLLWPHIFDFVCNRKQKGRSNVFSCIYEANKPPYHSLFNSFFFLLGVNELSQSIMWLAKPERLLALAD